MAYAKIVMANMWPGSEQTSDYSSKLRSNIEN